MDVCRRHNNRKRTLAIGRHESVPVEMAPRAVVAYADVPHKALTALIAFYGDRKRLRTGSCGYNAPVAVGLLHVVVVAFDEAAVVTVQLLIPLHRTEIC